MSHVSDVFILSDFLRRHLHISMTATPPGSAVFLKPDGPVEMQISASKGFAVALVTNDTCQKEDYAIVHAKSDFCH